MNKYNKNENSFVLNGPELHKPLNKASVGIQLYDSLISNGDKDIFIQAETNEKVTYAEYFKKTRKLAQVLRNIGLGKSDVISICSENNLKYYEPVLACLYLGIALSPINQTYTEYEILHMVNITQPKAIFCSSSVAGKCISVLKKCDFIQRIIILDAEKCSSELLELYRHHPQVETLDDFCGDCFDDPNFKPVEVDTKEYIAVILSSSGTTGLPKGVMVTHLNLSMCLNQAGNPYLHVFGGAKVGSLPFFHGFGFITTLSSMVFGETVVVLSKFKEELFYSTLEKYGVTELNVAPPILVLMAKSPLASKYNFSSVKCIISGAAPLAQNIAEEVKKRYNISINQGYGLTEATLAILLTPINECKPGSSGKVVPGMSCKIRDPETGASLGPRQVGELCIRGDMVAKGYMKNPKATAETFRDGWVFSGDMAYYDEEGYFYIVDRLKELIKYKGFQVAPAELEALLLKHAGVKDVGVVGKPDDQAGELPVAFVVRQHGVNVSEDDLKKFVQDHLSHTKWLHGGVIFVNEIPKNPSGKILRRELRNKLEKMNLKQKL